MKMNIGIPLSGIWNFFARKRGTRTCRDCGGTGKLNKIRCPRCDNKMVDMQACHMFCPTCGAHLDCSDKGNFW
ncbi:hypothetical protein LCGC14_2566590 [marine sediment metagenome]|uniref:Uncharacterized protein n=1 Tax=marine sediment metagenome TaxID=412755 RepID=A0A0F9DBD5_9ZZZZ